MDEFDNAKNNEQLGRIVEKTEEPIRKKLNLIEVITIALFILGILTIISAFWISYVQNEKSVKLLTAQLASDKIDSIVKQVDYVRMKYIDYQEVLCTQKPLDYPNIKMFVFKHHDAAEKLLSMDQDFRKRIGKQGVEELECYADYHAELFPTKVHSGYCTLPVHYAPDTCRSLSRNYKNNCYKSYVLDNNMEKWSICVTKLITHEAENRYGLNLSILRKTPTRVI